MSITKPLPEAVVPTLLLDTPSAAKALSISPRKLWELTNEKAIRCVRIGRAVRYRPADLQEWIDLQIEG